MKTQGLCSLLIILQAAGAWAQDRSDDFASRPAPDPAARSEFVVTERGGNHRVWERLEYRTDPDGRTIPRVHRYTELATGMYCQDNGQWVESKEQVEPLPDGAVARHGQHQVIFANDLATAGAIDLQTPDGKRLQSHIIGLSYFDTASGQSVLIAEMKNCVGQILPPNQVIYEDAFTDFKADVRYTYTRAAFEQDIILRERPPLPEEYGLSSATTVLQVLTEFLSPPQPIVTRPMATVDAEAIADENLDFGGMKIGRGKAFLMGNDSAQIPVRKQWLKLEGRDFLVESVPVAACALKLDQLPVPEHASIKPVRNSALHAVSMKRLLPERKVAAVKKGEMKIAQSRAPGKGLVLDYITVNSETVAIKGDTTYYLTGPAGASAIEGGAVIKYADSSASLSAFVTSFSGTGPYRPVILTSMHDDSVGETISGSTGNPTNTGATYLYCPDVGPPIKHLHFAYAGTAISHTYGPSPVWHCQFIKCATAIEVIPYSDGYVQELHNVLFSQCQVGVFANCGYMALSGEHVTADRMNTFFSTFETAKLTNSILTDVTNVVLLAECGDGPEPSATLDHCITANNGNGTYQSAGAGNYYLADGSTNRNAGTTSIPAALLGDLKIRTTYPPVLYSNAVFAVDTLLNPQAQRDNDTPDLGYHYDPIDFITDNCPVTNATLTVGSGAAIACYNEAGIRLQNGGAIVSVGTPLSPNWFVRYSSVQEQPVALGGTNIAAGQNVSVSSSGGPAPNGTFRFSKFAAPANGGSHLIHNGSAGSFSNLAVQDCEFWCGTNNLSGWTNSAVTVLKNNLFWRSPLCASNTSAQASLSLSNNLFSSCIPITLSQPGSGVWYAFNNAFDRCTNAGCQLTNGYNAYINCTGRLNPTNANDLVLTNFTYATGTLGDFYHSSTNLLNKGSVTANLTGLYHFTTLTNQVKETNSIVDIGFHYVATTNGVPIDTDGDGLPDYIEDANGNGTVDSGETDWQSATDLGLKVWITRPRNNSTIP